jgi:hypothetical protein
VGFSWLKRLFGDSDEPIAGRRHGDLTLLDRPVDPRSGTQGEKYRHTDPRDVVEEGGTVMSGPGGAPQEGLTPGERRKLDRSSE